MSLLEVTSHSQIQLEPQHSWLLKHSKVLHVIEGQHSTFMFLQNAKFSFELSIYFRIFNYFK